MSKEFEIIDRDKGQNIVSSNIKLYRHEVKNKSNETKLKEQEPESSNIDVDRDEVHQKINEIVVYVDDLHAHAVPINTNPTYSRDGIGNCGGSKCCPYRWVSHDANEISG